MYELDTHKAYDRGRDVEYGVTITKVFFSFCLARNQVMACLDCRDPQRPSLAWNHRNYAVEEHSFSFSGCRCLVLYFDHSLYLSDRFVLSMLFPYNIRNLSTTRLYEIYWRSSKLVEIPMRHRLAWDRMGKFCTGLCVGKSLRSARTRRRLAVYVLMQSALSHGMPASWWSFFTDRAVQRFQAYPNRQDGEQDQSGVGHTWTPET